MDKNIFFFKTLLRRNPVIHIKYSAILIPILSIICMFATVVILPSINQKIFFNNSNYEQVSFFEKNETDTFFTQGGILADFQNSNYYLSNILISSKCSETISSIIEKNVHDSTENNKNNISIGLSYNIISNLDLDLGDTAIIICYDEAGEVIEIEGKIAEIYNPFYFNLESNMYDESYGLCVIYGSDLNIRGIQGRCISTQKINTDCTYTKTEQKRSVHTISLIDIFSSAIIPLLSLVLLVTINYNNIRHILNDHKRNFGIFLVLGYSIENVYNIFFVYLILMNFISIIGATIMYKFLVFDVWLKQLVPNQLLITIILLMLLICIICNYTCLKLQYKNMKEGALISVLYERIT